MNRGSTEGLWAACCEIVRFNEAPIHESGKSQQNRIAARRIV